MNEAEPMVTSMWAFMASWLTPSVLFCVLNLTIGTIFIISKLQNQNKHQQKQQLGEDNSPQLVRTPSLLERVKSINLSFYRSESVDPFHPMAHHTDPTHDRSEDQTLESQSQNPKEDLGLEGHVTRSKSEMGGKTPAMVEPTMKKSASEKAVAAVEVDVDHRRPATVRERKGKGKWSETASSGEDETVDAKADDFIERFKQQLKLQRLDSLLRVKEMLNRGAGR
ncbi:unnamed protein product [Ilex paraguariensis]|uniref:DUF4408 domain-containing protein n=1 Tax=Ilex paraguariensis TaxID=185542 RepID=A0ABC8RAF1_9AQUA